MSDNTIEALGAAFEEAYLRGENPLLQDWLTRVPKIQQAELFRKLLEIELSQKQAGAVRKSLEDYVIEFPDYEELAACYAQLSQQEQAELWQERGRI